MTELKKKAAHGLKWSAIERILTQGMQFVMMIVIARQLSPDDFGLVGMLAIFMAISQTFIDSGFSSALIRKGEPSEVECSTAFYFNIAVGVSCYALLFLAAPYIAKFYDEPILSELTKVIGLNVVFSSLAVVQRAKLTIALDFKKQSKVSLLAVTISGALGITMAYNGFGVWSLVAQTVSMNGLLALLLWVFVGWYPRERFCYTTFKELFNFGSKLLASGLIDTVYRNIYQIIIGKQFSAAQLGYFTQAKQLSEVPATNITNIIQRVNFPMMSQIKDDNEKLEQAYEKAIVYTALVVFPIMCAIAVMAKPIILILLGEKWITSAPLLSVLSFTYMLYPIHAINLNLLKVKGRSDLFLKLEVIKKIITTITLFITVPVGIKAMCIGMFVNSVIALVINTYYTGKLTSLNFYRQIKLITPVLAFAIIAALIGFIAMLYSTDLIGQFISCSAAGAVTYLVLAYFRYKNYLLK